MSNVYESFRQMVKYIQQRHYILLDLTGLENGKKNNKI